MLSCLQTALLQNGRELFACSEEMYASLNAIFLLFRRHRKVFLTFTLGDWKEFGACAGIEAPSSCWKQEGVFPRETPRAVLCGGVGASAAIVGVLHPLNSSVELWLSGCFSEGESCERQRELSPFLGSQMAEGLGAEQCLGAPLPVAAFLPHAVLQGAGKGWQPSFSPKAGTHFAGKLSGWWNEQSSARSSSGFADPS